MKCNNCGHDITENAAFCSNCGSPTFNALKSDNSTEQTKDSYSKDGDTIKGLSKKRAVFILVGMCLVIIAELIVVKFIIPMAKYNHAKQLLGDKKYDEAYSILEDLDTFNHAPDTIKQSEFDRALGLCEEGNYEEGYSILGSLGTYNNADEEILKNKYSRALELIELKQYESAYSLLKEIAPYKDAENVINDSIYERAISLKEEKDYEKSYDLLTKIRGYEKKENDEVTIDTNKEITEVYALLVSSMLDKYSKDGQDGPALKYLRTAIANSDASETLKELYTKKEKEYKDNCLRKAQQVFKKSGYDAAISFLKSAKTYLPENDKELSSAIAEYEKSKPTIPQELKKYENALVDEGKTYRVSLDHDDWYINYRSTPEFISIDESENNILGKMKHGTEIYVEYIYDKTWAVFEKDGEYVFASLFSSNDPSKDRLLEVVR